MTAFSVSVWLVCFPIFDLCPLVPTLQRSSLYTGPTGRENTVIPAWMPESSHRDVNLRLTQALVQAASYPP